MSELTLFGLSFDGCIEPMEYGGYVSLSDYRALEAQLEAAKKDAERYLKLRRMAVELSLSHQVISQFVTNQGELDAAIAEGKQA